MINEKTLVINPTFKLPLFLLLDQSLSTGKKKSCARISTEVKFFNIKTKPLALAKPLEFYKLRNCCNWMAMKRKPFLNYLDLKGTVVHNECYTSRLDRIFLLNHNYQGQEINTTSCILCASKHPLSQYMFNLLYFRQCTSWPNFLFSFYSQSSCSPCTLQRVNLTCLHCLLSAEVTLH